MSDVLQFYKDAKCSSYWLRQAISDLEKRDPLDALCDAEKLVAAMHERWFAAVKDKDGTDG